MISHDRARVSASCVLAGVGWVPEMVPPVDPERPLAESSMPLLWMGASDILTQDVVGNSHLQPER